MSKSYSPSSHVFFLAAYVSDAAASVIMTRDNIDHLEAENQPMEKNSARPQKDRMNASERRASTALASIYGLRMLGLFLILPVFAIYAGGLPTGNNHGLVGLALGIYGLTQATLQIPFGIASDHWAASPS
jgi:hypothetical protein